MRDAPDVYTTAEACTRLRVSKQTLYRMEHRGIITPIRLIPGGHKKWARTDIDNLVEPPATRRARATKADWRPARGKKSA